MNNKKNIDDYFDDNFEVTYTGDLPSIPVGQDDYDDRYDDTDYLNDYETDDYYDETDRLAPDYDDDYEEEDSYYDRQRPARRTERRNSRRRPIPLPKNWLLQSGILPAPEVLPLRN